MYNIVAEKLSLNRIYVFLISQNRWNILCFVDKNKLLKSQFVEEKCSYYQKDIRVCDITLHVMLPIAWNLFVMHGHF